MFFKRFISKAFAFRGADGRIKWKLRENLKAKTK
jgi:hypothetical protein